MLNSQSKTNKNIVLIITAFVLAQSSDWASAVDFNSLLQSAQKNSTELAIVKANVEEAKALYQASNSKFYPRLGVESRYENFESEFELLKGGTSNFFIDWNLFNGFKDTQARKSLGAEYEAANLEQNRLEMNLKWIAMAKYTKAQVMQENVQSYKNLIESNQKNLETVKMRRASGRLSDADFLEFELFDMKLKQDLILLETAAMAAKAELEAFSGMSSIQQLTTKLEPKKLSLDDVKLVELLSSDRSKLNESRLKVEAAEAINKLSVGGYLPDLNLKASYGSMGLRDTEVSPETAFGIFARWELFSGFETLNDRKVSSAQLMKAKAEYENNKIQSLSRAEQLRNLLKSIIARYDFEEKNLKNIEKFIKTVQSEYRLGTKSSNDLKSALELALESQLNRSSLRSDYFEARAELQDILGTELTEL